MLKLTVASHLARKMKERERVQRRRKVEKENRKRKKGRKEEERKEEILDSAGNHRQMNDA